MKLESYWLDSAPAFSAPRREPVAGRADVAIVGGGFTGLSAALALAKRGADVIVLEAGRVISEASGRNGGHCNNGLPHDFTGLVGKYGKERARAFYLAHSAAVDSVERLTREEAIDCDFRRTGRLKLAAKPRHFDALARAAEVLQREVDPHVSLISAERIRDEIASDQFYGGLLQSTSAQLHVGRFGVGLAEAAARRGARIHEQSPVVALNRREGTSHEVVTPNGSVFAKQVLLATGCSQYGPFGWVRRRIAPVGAFIVVTEPLEPARLTRLLPQRRNYVTSRHIGNFFRTTPDNRLLFGGRARFAVSNSVSDRKSGDILERSLAQVFPTLGAVRIDYCWGGMVDITADRLPRAGQHEGVYYSLGYSGHGVQMSVHMGQCMAAVLEGRLEANPWASLDWPAIPGHFGKPWFLPLVGLYYRALDAVQ